MSFPLTARSAPARSPATSRPPASTPTFIGGSVNATDLANSAVSDGKLAPNSVNGSKVTDASLTSADTNPSSIQHRVNGSCPSDQAAQSVVQDGSLNCGVINGGTPGGSAGGDLAGTYPNPSLGTGVVGADALTPLGSDSTDTAPVVSSLSSQGQVGRVSVLKSPNVGSGGPDVVPAGGTLVLQVRNNNSTGSISTKFDLHLLVQPVP